MEHTVFFKFVRHANHYTVLALFFPLVWNIKLGWEKDIEGLMK